MKWWIILVVIYGALNTRGQDVDSAIVRDLFYRYGFADDQDGETSAARERLYSLGKDITPDLIQIFESTNDVIARHAIINAFSNVGPTDQSVAFVFSLLNQDMKKWESEAWGARAIVFLKEADLVTAGVIAERAKDSANLLVKKRAEEVLEELRRVEAKKFDQRQKVHRFGSSEKLETVKEGEKEGGASVVVLGGVIVFLFIALYFLIRGRASGGKFS